MTINDPEHRPEIVGFIVVRKPGLASTPDLSNVHELDGKLYHGVDRLPWEDLDAAYYDGNLRAELLSIRETLREESLDLSGFVILRDLAQARKVRDSWSSVSDIIAIWSRDLVQLKGVVRAEIDLDYLGLDCVGGLEFSNEWSVLSDGLYRAPEHFGSLRQRINAYGLLDSEDDCRAVFSRYVALSAQDIVEPLAESATPMIVKVFAVR